MKHSSLFAAAGMGKLGLTEMLATKAKMSDNLARDGGACQTSKIWTYSAISACNQK